MAKLKDEAVMDLEEVLAFIPDGAVDDAVGGGVFFGS